MRLSLWLALPGLLAIFIQLGAMGLAGHARDPLAFVSFQTMLSLMPWLSLLTFGFDKLAREHVALRPIGLPGYPWLLKRACVFSLACGAILGLVCASAFNESKVPWVLYCSGIASGYALGSGREALLSTGRVVAANKILTLAHGAILLSFVLMFIFPLGVAGWILAWTGPLFLSSVAYYRISGLSAPSSDVPSLRQIVALSTKALKLGVPFVGWASLCSFDVILLRNSLLAPAEVMTYIVLTRAVFVTFAFSSLAVGPWIVGLAARDRAVFARSVARICATHAGISCMAVVALVFLGPIVLPWLVPGLAWGDPTAALPPLLALALGRSISESALLASYGRGEKTYPVLVLVVTVAGMSAFAWAQPSHWTQAVWWAAAAWAAPAAAFIGAYASGMPRAIRGLDDVA